jgi:hypothetical protein
VLLSYLVVFEVGWFLVNHFRLRQSLNNYSLTFYHRDSASNPHGNFISQNFTIQAFFRIRIQPNFALYLTPSEAVSLPLVILFQIVSPTGPSCFVSPSPTENRSVSPEQNSSIWDRYNELTVSLEFKAFSGGVQVCAERPVSCPPFLLCSPDPLHPPALLCLSSTRSSSMSQTQQGLTRRGC